MKTPFLPAFAFACAAFACCAQTVSVKSPDGKNEIRLETEPALTYAVYRDGVARIAPTPLALALEGRAAFDGKGAKVAGVANARRTGAAASPLYKKAQVALEANEAVVSFDGGWRVELVARDDAVAYRFATALPGTVRVVDEKAGVTFPSPDTVTWTAHEWGGGWKGDVLQNSWESIYQKKAAKELSAEKGHCLYLPIVAQYPDGVALCVTESDLLDYPGWNLTRTAADGETGLSAFMARVPDPAKIEDNRRQRRINGRLPYLAETAGTRTYPWRTFILAASPAKLVENDAVWALATPCRLAGDLSWIKPGKVAWDWWNDWNVTGVDFKSGCNTRTYEYYIDFASKHGIEYVIFDEGWSQALQIMKINPAVDVPKLVKYAALRDVGIVLWCSWPQLLGRQHEIFKHYAAMGVKGFKIDFMDRDDQVMERFLEETARIAAEYKLLVDYHGMHKPTGLSRTYPNVLNYEGVHGLEQCKWENGDAFPQNDLNSYFIRMSAGPMDYTPGAMRNATRPGERRGYRPSYSLPESQGTRVHQMALMTLYEAPLQMLCDSPSAYLANPECFAFMAAVPTTWDETVALGGDMEGYAAVARRKGDVWYVAAIANWNARSVKLPTGFLGDGTWCADVFADGANADRDATDWVRRAEDVKAGKPLDVRFAPGGGYTARLVRKPWWKW